MNKTDTIYRLIVESFMKNGSSVSRLYSQSKDKEDTIERAKHFLEDYKIDANAVKVKIYVDAIYETFADYANWLVYKKEINL